VFSSFDNRLRENPQAHDGVANHEYEHGVLTPQSQGTITQQAHGDEMRQRDSNHVSDNDRKDCRIPGKTCSHDANIEAIRGRPKQVPATPQWVGEQGNQTLSVDEEE
jgi:hypothetical protein